MIVMTIVTAGEALSIDGSRSAPPRWRAAWRAAGGSRCWRILSEFVCSFIFYLSPSAIGEAPPLPFAFPVLKRNRLLTLISSS